MNPAPPVTRMVSLMAGPGEIYNICYACAAMAGNLVKAEQCRCGMNVPIQRLASHPIRRCFVSGADFPLNTDTYPGCCPSRNGQHLQRFRLSLCCAAIL